MRTVILCGTMVQSCPVFLRRSTGAVCSTRTSFSPSLHTILFCGMLVLPACLTLCSLVCLGSFLFHGPLALSARPAPRFSVSFFFHGPLALSARPAPRFSVSFIFHGPLALSARPAPRFSVSSLFQGPLALSARPAPRFSA
jgi:hypothetical protein